MLISRMLAKKYHLSAEKIPERLKGLSPEELMALGEYMLECDSFDAIEEWLQQRIHGNG